MSSRSTKYTMTKTVKSDSIISKGGRPASGTLEQRLEQLLNDATQVFLKKGYGSTTIDLIAREAHVAKRTIYQHFGGKEKLFGAIVRLRIDQLFSLFPEVDADEGSLEPMLTGVAHALLTVVLSPEATSLERIIISEATRFPELAREFYDNGPEQVIGVLAQYLARQHRLGTIQLSNPETAAVYFFSLTLGEFHRRVMLNIEQSYSPEQIDNHVDEVVDFFLSAYGV